MYGFAGGQFGGETAWEDYVGSELERGSGKDRELVGGGVIFDNGSMSRNGLLRIMFRHFSRLFFWRTISI